MSRNVTQASISTANSSSQIPFGAAEQEGFGVPVGRVLRAGYDKFSDLLSRFSKAVSESVSSIEDPLKFPGAEGAEQQKSRRQEKIEFADRFFEDHVKDKIKYTGDDPQEKTAKEKRFSSIFKVAIRRMFLEGCSAEAQEVLKNIRINIMDDKFYEENLELKHDEYGKVYPYYGAFYFFDAINISPDFDLNRDYQSFVKAVNYADIYENKKNYSESYLENFLKRASEFCEKAIKLIFSGQKPDKDFSVLVGSFKYRKGKDGAFIGYDRNPLENGRFFKKIVIAEFFNQDGSGAGEDQPEKDLHKILVKNTRAKNCPDLSVCTAIKFSPQSIVPAGQSKEIAMSEEQKKIYQVFKEVDDQCYVLEGYLEKGDMGRASALVDALPAVFVNRIMPDFERSYEREDGSEFFNEIDEEAAVQYGEMVLEDEKQAYPSDSLRGDKIKLPRVRGVLPQSFQSALEPEDRKRDSGR